MNDANDFETLYRHVINIASRRKQCRHGNWNAKHSKWLWWLRLCNVNIIHISISIKKITIKRKKLFVYFLVSIFKPWNKL